MSESKSVTQSADRDDSAVVRQPSQALRAVQVALDRRDNGGDGAAILER